MDLSAPHIHAALIVVDDEGWDGPAGRGLLELVRKRIVEPTVRRAGLRGPAADQACASGWAAAWDALRRPSARSADNPAGMAWVAVRRAVADEVAPARRGRDGLVIDLVWDVDGEQLSAGLSGGACQDPFEDDRDPSSCPVLDPVLGALRAVGWQPELLSALVAELGAQAPGRGSRWRTAADRVGCPAWRASRLWTLLAGAPGVPGLAELVEVHGQRVLEDPDLDAAIRSTVREWLPAPATFLRAAASARAVSIASAGSPCLQAIWPMSEPAHTLRAPMRCGHGGPRVGKLSSITGEGASMAKHVQDSVQSRHTHESCPVLLDRH